MGTPGECQTKFMQRTAGKGAANILVCGWRFGTWKEPADTHGSDDVAGVGRNQEGDGWRQGPMIDTVNGADVYGSAFQRPGRAFKRGPGGILHCAGPNPKSQRR